MDATVVLLHAFPLDHRMWAHQGEALASAGCRVIAPDLPGFGGTQLPAGEPDLQVVAADVLDRLAEHGVDRAIVAGLSLGGYVAMAMMRVRPALFDAVILCDTKASADSPDAAGNRTRLAAAVTADPGQCGRILRHAIIPGLLGPTTQGSRPAVVDRVGGWLDEANPAAVAWYQQAMAVRPDSHEVLHSIDAPALVLWGDEDALSPEPEQQSMLDVLRHGQRAVIPAAGHLSAVEYPDAVSRAFLQFVSTVRADPAAMPDPHR